MKSYQWSTVPIPTPSRSLIAVISLPFDGSHESYVYPSRLRASEGKKGKRGQPERGSFPHFNLSHATTKPRRVPGGFPGAVFFFCNKTASSQAPFMRTRFQAMVI